MTIRVTITKPGVTDAYGIAMAVGTTYTVEENFGLSLIQQGRASDTDEFLDERINAPFDEVVYPLDPVGLSADGTSLVSGDEIFHVNPPREVEANIDIFDFELDDAAMQTLNGLGTDNRVGPDPETFTRP